MDKNVKQVNHLLEDKWEHMGVVADPKGIEDFDEFYIKERLAASGGR
jgi:hypothetical protein